MGDASVNHRLVEEKSMALRTKCTIECEISSERMFQRPLEKIRASNAISVCFVATNLILGLSNPAKIM